MQRLLPPLLVLLLGLGATAVHLVTGLATTPPLLRWSGLPVGLLGLAMSVWGSRRFAHVGTNIQTFDQPDVLVSDGLFRWSRNPMYLGFVMVLVGVALAIGSWLGWAAPAVFFLVADRWYIPFEEMQMRLTFSQHYEDYCRHVRRWVGRRTTPAT